MTVINMTDSNASRWRALAQRLEAVATGLSEDGVVLVERLASGRNAGDLTELNFSVTRQCEMFLVEFPGNAELVDEAKLSRLALEHLVGLGPIASGCCECAELECAEQFLHFVEVEEAASLGPLFLEVARSVWEVSRPGEIAVDDLSNILVG